MTSRQVHDKQIRINNAFNKTINKQTILFVRELLNEPDISSGELKTKLDRSPYEIKTSQRVDEESQKVGYRIVASRDNIIVDGIQFTVTGGVPKNDF